MRRDIDEAIQGWPYEPEPGEVIAREVRARDGRTVLQIRVELGVLQLEVERPARRRRGRTGSPPTSTTSATAPPAAGSAPGGKAPPWTMSPEHCAEADREFVQFYHRRVAWLALQRYDKALLDADHTLALMDFVAEHGIDEEYIASHERFRGLVLFHRTQAAAALALERRKPEEAIDVVREGIDRLAAHQEAGPPTTTQDESPNQPLIEQLRVLEQEIRKNFAVEKTLREQLDEAVAREDYERAARLRDQIRAGPPLTRGSLTIAIRWGPRPRDSAATRWKPHAMSRPRDPSPWAWSRCGARPTPTTTSRRACEVLREAARRGAQVACLPELFRTQYFCQAEDAARFDLAEPIPGPTTEAPGRGRAGDGDGRRRLDLRAAGGRGLPQHGGRPRRRRLAPRPLPQDAHPRRPALLREVLLHPRRPRLPGVRDRARAGSARSSAGTSGIPRPPG